MKPFLYERLYASLLLELAGGHYAPGARFLSLRGMMERFGASKITTNAVQRRLLEEGFIRTRPRSGTFVAPGAREQAMLALAAHEPTGYVMPHTWQQKAERLRVSAGAARPRRVMILYSIPQPDAAMLPSREWPNLSPRTSRGCLDAARERHAEATLIFHNGSEARQQQVLEWMKEADLGGAIIGQRSATFGHFQEIVNPLLARGLPVVNLFGAPHGIDLASVDFNNVAGGFQAGMRMLAAGHRRLTVVHWANAVSSSTVLRIEGIRLAAQQYGATLEEIPVDALKPQIELPCLFSKGGRGRVSEASEACKAPEAILCLSFEFARELLGQARGIAEPGRDFSIIAFSSIAEVEPGRSIDIIRMDFDLLGATAMNLLLDTMEGKEAHRTVLIPMPDEAHGSVCQGC